MLELTTTEELTKLYKTMRIYLLKCGVQRSDLKNQAKQIRNLNSEIKKLRKNVLRLRSFKNKSDWDRSGAPIEEDNEKWMSEYVSRVI